MPNVAISSTPVNSYYGENHYVFNTNMPNGYNARTATTIGQAGLILKVNSPCVDNLSLLGHTESFTSPSSFLPQYLGPTPGDLADMIVTIKGSLQSQSFNEYIDTSSQNYAPNDGTTFCGPRKHSITSVVPQGGSGTLQVSDLNPIDPNSR